MSAEEWGERIIHYLKVEKPWVFVLLVIVVSLSILFGTLRIIFSDR